MMTSMISGNYSSRKDWIELIGKDAGGLIHHPVFGNIQGNSFPHAEDLQGKSWPEISVLPDPARLSGIVLDKSQGFFSASDLRARILYALTHGAEHLRFHLNPEGKPEDLSFLLEGVYLDMVRLSLVLSADWFVRTDSLSKAALQSVAGPLNLEMGLEDFWNHREDFKNLVSTNSSITLTPVLEFSLSHADLWAETLSRALIKFQSIQAEFPEARFVLRLLLSDDFLTGISAIRAFRMWSAQTGLYPFIFEAGPDSALLGSEPFSNQIYQTTAALAAVLGGSETVWMLPSDYNLENPSPDWMRTALHTMHILKQESHLDLVRDPLEGSYYVEDLSLKIMDHLMTAV